ncbi:MAG: DUF2288 domain-containing protein [Pegethrix bostrychoides GSE-TBD4-15B]|jgi:hypothetical protein|uniref:DUF2288 domain-containing protein n=1 Tax=Pegethrix bostrychoides GSE-TBD4-15B TaxID=2839662 RepID=A0A951PCM7_9CYAN|nr:DUF2288 domain-containing protein [Pegethrix bostrychoides GSE-TBD4-15B]
MPDLRSELAETLDEAEWEWLMPHAKRDAIVMVASELDLLDVGVAIANDDKASVEGWIGQQQLYKPSPEQLSDWGSDPTRRFKALIVQPYVLVQMPCGEPV